ncbi:MAG: hypothetical protein KatS3mg110_2933 [Pirellulaceae bacterium]|nr:MAG: hypothetical protein KatS3mg110_2933 [Pirellulaceae bacterium]
MVSIRHRGWAQLGAITLIVAGLFGSVSGRLLWAQGAGGGGQNQQNVQQAGVAIDAEGFLRLRTFPDPTGALTRQRMAEAAARLEPDLARPSPLRKISLNRLEAALAVRLASGQAETDEMRYLAGLTRITHVFYYPETRDVVIAGPAEGFFVDLSGRPIGIRSGHVVMELADLVAALRAFPPSGKRTSLIGCSIDPDPEGLQRLQQFLGRVGRNVSRVGVDRLVAEMKQVLGPQRVTVSGVSDKTHFAQVLVEADYRMKLISIALERPPVDIGSYAERALRRGAARNALARFYLTPNYECVRVSEDGLAMRLEGEAVRLMTEQELITAQGQRVQTGGADPSAEAFARAFTEHYPALAARVPVFAQLRNLIDLSIAAAFIQQQDYYSQADWYLGIWADESGYAIETGQAPKMVESAVNVLWRGNLLMTPIGGGVNIQPRLALQPERLLPDEGAQVAKVRPESAPVQLKPSQWWWD